MTKPNILLLNPPIYDFSAYDFWIKPYGMLKIAGYLRTNAHIKLFDFLDRTHPFYNSTNLLSDEYGRGKYYSETIEKPKVFQDIPRYYKRYGLPKNIFQNWLAQQPSFDFIFIQSGMTYWYLGIKEVIEIIRKTHPKAKIILGGIYAELCPEHANSLNPDIVIKGQDIQKLEKYLNLSFDYCQPPYWEAYEKLETGILKITEGCPFNCTYCSVKKIAPNFKSYKLNKVINEFKLLQKQGATNIAFYDDALLFKPKKILLPFLKETKKLAKNINFHTPNALHIRYISEQTLQEMIDAGFKTFFLGIENTDSTWQKNTGGKTCLKEIEKAVNIIKSKGISPKNITAYLLMGHPDYDISDLEKTMEFIKQLGIKIFLSEFSPVPGSKDSKACEKWIDLSDPLTHNKTAFTTWQLGFEETNRLKGLASSLNKRLA
jgi:radical SAM superfamily enzyme YgiQ (UPF0313 family)